MEATNPRDETAQPPNSAKYFSQPLENPATQIRLLRYIPGDSKDPMDLELTTWLEDEAPKYNAISYTWGPPVDAAIRINGIRFWTRRNCLDAMRQALSYNPDIHIWVDSICINQDDVHEKAIQVQKMHAIYRDAWEVLSCVGEHADDTELLVQMCHIVEECHPGTAEPDKEETEALLQSLSAEGFDLFLDDAFIEVNQIMLAFGHRPYWSRLWIVQEIIAGAGVVRVLCGDGVVSYKDLKTLLALVEGVGGARRLWNGPIGAIATMMSECERSGTLPLPVLLRFFGASKCSDPRDRIYGLLALVDWEGSGMEPIFPDYARPLWSLATQMTQALDTYDCSHIMHMLSVDSDTPEMRSMIQRRSLWNPPIERRMNVQDFPFHKVLVARVRKGPPGLCTEPIRGQRDNLDFDWILELADSADACAQLFKNNNPPLKVFSAGRAIALVCSGCVAGDLLVMKPGRTALKNSCLVLRPRTHERLDVVGLGFVQSGREYPWHSSEGAASLPWIQTTPLPEHAMFQAELQISASSEDIMLLFHEPSPEQAIDQAEADLLRIMIQPIGNPQAAARLVPRGIQQSPGPSCEALFPRRLQQPKAGPVDARFLKGLK